MSYFRKIKFSSVGLKVFVSYVASMVVIVSVMGYLSYGKSSEMMESKIGGMALQNVQQTKKRIENIVEEYDNRLLLIFGSREIQKELTGDFRDELERIAANKNNNAFLSNLINPRNDTESIYLLGERGMSFRYSPKNNFFVYSSYPMNHEEEPWYRAIREADGRTVFFGIRPSFPGMPGDPEPALVFCLGRAMKNLYGHGEIIGVALMEIDPKEIMDILAEIDYDGSGMNLIADASGRVIGDKDGLALGTQLDAELPEEQHGIYSRTIGGDETLVVYDRFAIADWSLVGLLHGPDLMKDAKDIRWYMLSLGVIFGSAGIVLALLIASSVHRPLHKMIRAMRKARDGEFDVRIADSRQDEFGYLFNHFNEMVARIKELIDELYVQKLLKQDLQLKMLGSQINAHFLYNTLDSVHWIARIHKVDDISAMVFGLSRYFRLSLSEGRDEVSVGEVVQLLDSYILIQKIRYRDKFTMSLEADESLKDARVLKYIFQPIVENAIYHGLEKKEGEGRLDVRFEKRDDLLLFAVEDDGAGIEPGRLAELRALLSGPETGGEGHFALRNINAQIKILYGPDYGIEVDSALGKGTRVVMTIPLRKSK